MAQTNEDANNYFSARNSRDSHYMKLRKFEGILEDQRQALIDAYTVFLRGETDRAADILEKALEL